VVSGPAQAVSGLAWTVTRMSGPAAVLHAAGLPDPPQRLIRWCEADAPALVLGSAQAASVVDAEAAARAGLAVTRRRSGGSSVVVGPGRLVWADVVVPSGDPLWADDVGQAGLWLGDAWAVALGRLGVPGGAVHRGAMVRNRWSALVCFAGIGAGEMLIGGRKVVGVSQRRTRLGALFQVAVLLRWDPQETVAGLALPDDERQAGAAALAEMAVGLDTLTGRPVLAAEVEAAFEAGL
jgi:lipoate-protein ligase A